MNNKCTRGCAVRPAGKVSAPAKIGLSALVASLALSLTSTACVAVDADKGKKVFRKCAACHAVGEGAKNKIGPALNGIVGRKAGTIEGYKYSKANKKAGEDGWVWTEDVLAKYLVNPRKAMPGTKMAFTGLKNEEDRTNVVAYLKTFSSTDASSKKQAKAAQKPAEAKAEKPAAKPESKKADKAVAAKAPAATPAAKSTSPPQSGAAKAKTKDAKAVAKPATAAKVEDGPKAVSPPAGWVAGEAPAIRPPWAPRIERMNKGSDWYARALTGTTEPYPASFRFLEDQGAWHTPFNHHGMTGPYDLRRWHTE